MAPTFDDHRFKAHYMSGELAWLPCIKSPVVNDNRFRPTKDVLLFTCKWYFADINISALGKIWPNLMDCLKHPRLLLSVVRGRKCRS